MPPFKRGFVKSTVTPGSVKQTRKRKILEIENYPIEDEKCKTKRKIRATEELYNIPIISDETSESERRLTRSHTKTRMSFLPKIDDISDDQKTSNKSREQRTLQVTKEPKNKINHVENDQIPIRQTRSSTSESIKISNQTKETDIYVNVSPKQNRKELKCSGNVNEDEAIAINKTKFSVNRRSSRIEIQQEQKPVQNELKNQRLTRTSYRKSLIKTPQNIAKNVVHSTETKAKDDNFVSKESVYEILNYKSTCLEKLPDSRLTYDLNDIKNSPAFIKNRRETYDVENTVSVETFAKIETKLNIRREETTSVNDEAVLETTFDTKSTKILKSGTQDIILKENSNDQNLKTKDACESLEIITDIAQEIEYISSKETVSTETETDNLHEGLDNGTNNTYTKMTNSDIFKDNDLIDENTQYNEDEATKKIEGAKNIKDKYCENINNSLNELLDIGNSTFTKSSDSENNITLIEINESNKNVDIEIKNENKELKNNWCKVIDNSLNEPLHSANSTLKETMDFENNMTLKETKKNKNLQLKIKDNKDIVTTNLKELGNILQDKEDIVECKNSDSIFIKAANMGLFQNNNNVTDNIINETQDLTYEKYEVAKKIEINAKIKASDEDNLTQVEKKFNSPLSHEISNNGRNNTFATASDSDSSQNYSDIVYVTMTHEAKNADIAKEPFKILLESEKHSAEEILTKEQNDGDNLQNTITSTPPPLTSAETDSNSKTESAKIINRRSTFEIGESINDVTLLRTVCDEFGTPRETDNVHKRKYGESTPHPRKIEPIYLLEDETAINLINSPECISNDDKDCIKQSTSNSDEDLNDSVFEQKRISSINRLRKRRSKSLPINDESLTEFLFNEKMADDNYGRNVTKRKKKVTFKQSPKESVAISHIESPVKVSKIPKKLSNSLPNLIHVNPTSTSTPKPNAVLSLNKSKESIKKITRTKIPNFAEIHKKLFNKMENIKEHSQRKAERTKLLLSGHKPIDNNKENGNSKKKLNGNSTPAKENGKSKKQLNFYQKSTPNDNGHVRKVGQTQSNSTTLFRFGNQSTNSTTNVENQIKIQENKQRNVTKFGFKIIDGSKTLTKEEQKKAVIDKTKIIKNNRDERRNLIQGVRSNRRFDLLMKMREKKKN